MTQKSQAYVGLVGHEVPRGDAVQPNMVREDKKASDPLENATQPILTVTYWFDPEPHPIPYPVTVRFSGRRVDGEGDLSSGDQFVKDEIIEQVVPGSGPISVTTRVRNINAGEWTVTAHLQESQLSSTDESRRPQEAISAAAIQNPVIRFWHRWAPSSDEAESVKTCLIPFAHVPGILPGIWGMMVLIGIAIALVLQSLVIASIHLAFGSSWVISLAAIVAGIVGAKIWFIVVYRGIVGWCIQGFITAASLMAILLLVVLHVPVGAFLDATAPGLLIAMAVGRVGCFLGGCCGGPLTASRWGVWSSDQRVGARRIPTQLLEMVLAGFLGLGALVVILAHGTRGGAFFFGGLAVYTLVRQGILYLRAEQHKRMLGRRAVVALAALVVIVTVVLLAR